MMTSTGEEMLNRMLRWWGGSSSLRDARRTAEISSLALYSLTGLELACCLFSKDLRVHLVWWRLVMMTLFSQQRLLVSRWVRFWAKERPQEAREPSWHVAGDVAERRSITLVADKLASSALLTSPASRRIGELAASLSTAILTTQRPLIDRASVSETPLQLVSAKISSVRPTLGQDSPCVCVLLPVYTSVLLSQRPISIEVGGA